MKLFRPTFYFSLVMIMLALSSCTSSDKKSNKRETIAQEREKSADQNVLSAYYALKDALVASDVKMASQKAMTMTRALKKAHDYGSIIIYAQSIAGADNLDDQRVEFEKISTIIYEMAKASKFKADTVYRLYCPMAFDNKGAFWLSNSQTIMNPYFGDKMLHCGRVEETITAANR